MGAYSLARLSHDVVLFLEAQQADTPHMAGMASGIANPRSTLKRAALASIEAATPVSATRVSRPRRVESCLTAPGHVDPEQPAVRREVDRCRQNECARQSILMPVVVLGK